MNKTLKELKKEEALKAEAKLKKACESLVVERYGEEQVNQWEKEYKGLWYLPITEEDGTILAIGIMKPITRSVLSYASTKISEEGLYEFLEAAMRACWIEGDEAILDDDAYFIPASQTFNKMMEGYNAALVKR